MAERDLVAQKILSTDPQVGFGESAVLPYRQHSLDTRGFEAMERAQTRRAVKEEARKKNNEDYYNGIIKSLPEYQREFEQGIAGWRNEIIDRAYQNQAKGITNDPNLAKDVVSHIQASKATKQLNTDLEKINTMSFDKYTNGQSVKGAALKKYTELLDRVNQGDRSAFSESIMPDMDDPEHFKFNDYYNDEYSKRPDTITSQDTISYGPLGERITDKKVTARFVTTKKDESGREILDKDGNPIIVPGIDQSEIDRQLDENTADPYTQRAQKATLLLVDKQIAKKAQELKLTDPSYSDMGVEEIMSNISANPDDPHYKEFNKHKLAEGIVRRQLEKYQRVSNETDISAGHKYDKGDGGGSKTNKFKMAPAVITQESGRLVKGEDGEPTYEAGLSHNIPGVVLSKDNKPLTFNVAANTIYDFKTGLQDKKNTDRVPIKVNSIGYALAYKKTGQIISFKSVDEMENFINTKPLSELNKIDLNQYMFGNIQDKKTVSGDTGEDEEQNTNKSIAIKYDPKGETGGQLEIYSDGEFGKRQLTPDEQKVKDAWEKKTKKPTQTNNKITPDNPLGL
jgi:hypothetical protein